MLSEAGGPPVEPPHFRIYGDYAGSEPAFYRADDFAWVETLRANWRVIREEFENYCYRDGHRLTPNFVPDAVKITGWSGIAFFTCLRRYEANCAHFPRTVEVLESIPNVVSAFINLLEPHSRLPPHFGDTNVLYRAHLGLIVPGGAQECGMEVEGETVGWGEGEVFVFNDARRHRVWNDSERPRVVLVIDVAKPEYGGATPRLCARVLGSIVVMLLQARLPFVRRVPGAVTRLLHAAAGLPFRVYLALFGMQRRRRVAEIMN